MNATAVRGSHAGVSGSGWRGIYITGGLAGLAAGVVFRRNLGMEVSLFSAQKQPDTAAGWFDLLQANRLLGLAYLHVFDIVNYLLVSLMLLALAAALYRAWQSQVAIAAALGFLGIAVYLASNSAFSLLALSDQYAAAAGEAQRAMLLAAGQALLALNRFSLAGAHPGSAGFLSLLLTAASGLIFALVMLRSRVFNRATALVGVAANTLDLAYCAGFLFAPSLGETLAVLFIPAAGLLLMVWHILVGWRLVRIGRSDPALHE